MTKYQNYKHYKLPITINPLEYGKLIFKLDNIFIIYVTSFTIAVITKFDEFNEVKFFRKGDLDFIYKDHIIDENTFVRSLDSRKFTFKNNQLINTIKTIIQPIIMAIITILNSTTLLINLYKMKNIIKFFDNIYKNYKVELFILFEFFIILLVWIIFFDIFPEDNLHTSLITISLRKNYWYFNRNNILINKLGIRHFKDQSKKYYKNTWNSIYFKLENQIFSEKLIEFYFEKFWKIVSPKILEGCHIYILLKFQFSDNNFHNIGRLIRLDHNNYKSFINQIENYMINMGDYYSQSDITKIIFTYGFKKGEITENFSKSEINLMNFKDMKLPISLDPNDYGKIINKTLISEGNIYHIQDNLGRAIIFKEFEKENQVEYFKDQNIILKFKDNKFEEGKFLRILGKRKLFFENGNKSLEITSIVTPFISKIKKDKVEINNIITLDIETYGTKELIPYLISFYDGKKSYSFDLTDYNSIDLMMEACFKELFVRKYNKYQVYVHNLTKFDIIFLLKYLVKHVSINPLIHRGRIIQLSINYGPDLQYNLTFKDSYLILLASLEKLCKAFNVETIKSIFPHLFVNKDNLNYIGEVPNIKYFIKISEEDYNKYKTQFTNNWNLKKEAIRYCEIDCISLYQIIIKFNSMIFNLFSKNIHRYPTLPSLAFAIFRSTFMENENIPKLNNNIANNIRKGYTGGSTDMFIPKGKNIKCYDVNSLYPSVMLDQPMPIGKAESFNGDIRKFNKNAFGFFYVKVKCPEDILHPILQIKHKTGNEIKTISPVGTWSMWIFSPEMDNAKKYGYKFEIIYGYTFEKAIIFKEYVEFLYQIKSTYQSGDALYLIAKILLNSLYGRFGMNEIVMKYEIITKEQSLEIPEDKILDWIEIENYVLVGLKTESDENGENISIGVSAAITAYSRIHMTQFKNNSKIKLYYTDTDSIYTDSKLDEKFIDSKILGKLKLEYICDEAIFLGPKSYCLKTEKGLITKVKGLKDTSSLDIKDFKNLLIRDHKIELHHDKWFRKLSEGKINIKDQIYTLISTDNKRKFIYHNNKIVGTKSIILRD